MQPFSELNKDVDDRSRLVVMAASAMSLLVFFMNDSLSGSPWKEHVDIHGASVQDCSARRTTITSQASRNILAF